MNKGEEQSGRISNPFGETILIVDDEPANLAVVANYLADFGFRIKVAHTGETGLELARRIPPDLILLDVLLPGIDGFEVCRCLKADARTQAVPVIFMTILDNVEEKLKGFDAGGVDYITKPFQRAEVLARVTTHLTLHRLQQDLRELNRDLEKKVAERTAELTTANQQLQQDITRRKQAQMKLARERSLLRTLIDSASDLIFIKDRNGVYQGCNKAGEAFIGIPECEQIGKTDFDFFDREKAGEIRKADRRVLEDRKPLRIEEWVTGQDGSRLLMDTIKAPYYDPDGKALGLVGIGRDITERVRAEAEIRLLNQELEQRVVERTAKLEAANKELDAFAYSVSHDLRAPLRHIDGFLELLQKKAGTALDEQSRHYMDSIFGVSQKMGLLIDDLLSFSRMGRQAISFQQVDLETLVRDVIRELEPDTAGRDIAWRINDLPVVTGDRSMLRMVLVNLISNAVKFTRPCRQAEIEIGSMPGQASETVIFVRDNGVGFDMTYVDKLFGVFRRLHHADEFEGTGIGLANVRRIIARHGGRTWAQGQPERGAVFFFSLLRKQKGGGNENH